MRDIWGALMRNAHLMHYNAHKCTGMRTGENDTAYGRERHVTLGRGEMMGDGHGVARGAVREGGTHNSDAILA